MREYLGSSDIANTVMMLRTAFKGTITVVEGITDRRLYGKFFDKSNVEVVIAHSKDNVRSSVKEVNIKHGDGSVIGIVDSDLDLLNKKTCKPPLFRTDTRDSENMMCFSSAFSSVLEEYGDPERMSSFERRVGPIKDAILDASYPVGLLMFISVKFGFRLSFKELDFDYFLERKDLSCNVEKLVHSIVANTGIHAPDESLLIKLYSEEAKHPPEIVCRGHDIMSVMAFGLRNIFGSYNCRTISDSELAGSFRLAYTASDFKETMLYKDAGEWCMTKGIRLWS